jgi:hypothetical protein
MTETKQTYTEPVANLMALGDVRKEPEWRDYLAFGFTEADVPELCRMVLDDELYWADSETNEVWSAVHAWRALAQLTAESAVPALIERLGKMDNYDDEWAGEELPLVFGHIGQAALEPLRDFLADSHQDEWARSAAGRGLAEIGQRHPASRAECVAALSRQLEQFAGQEDNFNSFLIGDLIDLQGVEAAPVIERAFAANKVDVMVQGDWEEVQIALGLLAERQTPPPDYRALMAAQMGFDPDEMLSNLKALAQTKLQQKAERKAADQGKAKAKNKRKQAKQSRKQQRKRK